MSSPAKKRIRKTRDLSKAIELKPSEVYALYGISPSSLHYLCGLGDADRRLPSKLIPGRNGRLGKRLINHEQLRAWLAKWEV